MPMSDIPNNFIYSYTVIIFMVEEEYEPPSNEYITETVPRFRDAELTKWQLSPEEIVEKLEHDLKGEIPKWDKETETWTWKQVGKKLMNDNGVKMIITLVFSHIGKNTILSTLKTNEIASVMKLLHKHLTLHLSDKWKEYEIDKSDLTLINDIVTNTIWFALKRAENGAEKKFLSSTEKRVERTFERERESKRFPMIPSLGK